MSLLHNHVYDDNFKVIVGSKYPFELATINPKKYVININETFQWISENIKKLQKKISISDFLCKSNLSVYGRCLIDHCLLLNEINPKKKINKESEMFINISKLELIYNLLRELQKCNTKKGYIIRDKNKNLKLFSPIVYSQFSDLIIEEYNSFIKALNIFFSEEINLISNYNDKLKTQNKKKKN